MNLEAISALGAEPIKIIINLIDILIIAYVFYRLLLIIRGTRAEQLLKGLIILLAFSAISRWLGLSAVNWLINKVWTGIFIAIPVVFQPELRRALEQLGRAEIFSGRSADRVPDIEKHIDEVAAAAAYLARDKIGALIIWQRETGLKDFMDIGVDMDAVISRDLLINIFTPNTPLHDGAIIISNGRILKAGAFLPLSDNLHLDKRLGTRHRAAVGITEVSDSLAVVVSEETGGLSIAKDGRIELHISEKELRETLRRELSGQPVRKQYKWWRRPDDKE